MKQPPYATAALALADGTVFWGRGLGAVTQAVGEVCFNTSMTGYQEVLTDPSYAGQLITFTFPHVGNVGVNAADVESRRPAALGCVLRRGISEPSSHRAAGHLNDWLERSGLPGIAGVDTRALTRRIRDLGAPKGALIHQPEGSIDVEALIAAARAWSGLEGVDLAGSVSCAAPYEWSEGAWSFEANAYEAPPTPSRHVVAVDFGAKLNILRSLAAAGCRVTVVPARSTAAEILARRPDGVFLSNGPGDPAATGAYAVPMIEALIQEGLPIFGICLGHQLLARALGARTVKMHLGHRGANHPVQDLETGRVEITSQNHGFVVDEATLPGRVEVTHRSLFDGSVEGLRVKGRPIFSVQHHPEASPGPRDSHHLFERFVALLGGVGVG